MIATGLSNAAPAVEVGDLDGDGYSDVVADFPVARGYEPMELGRIALARGSPVGPRLVLDAPVEEQTTPIYAVSQRPWFFRAGDIDGDDVDDLGVAYQNPRNPFTTVYLGAPGGLTSSQLMSDRFLWWSWNLDTYDRTSNHRAELCTTAMDRTGDGIADLYGFYSYTFYWMFSPDPAITRSGYLWFRADSPGVPTYGMAPSGCATSGDVDTDGVADEMNQQGIPGDFDGDGRDDELYRGSDSDALGWNPHPRLESFHDIFLNSGFGAAQAGTFHSTGDVDGDGTSDLILELPGAAGFTVFLSDATGPLPDTHRLRLETMLEGSLGTGAGFALLGDLDGDGASEILRVAPPEREIVPSRRSPAARPLPERLLHSTSDAAVVAAGDLDGDGANDLVEVSASRQVTLHRLGLPSSIAPSPWMTLASAQRIHAGGDLNHDGLADLVREEGGQLTLFYGVRGATPVAGPSFAARASGPISRVVAAGDVDGDGTGDLLVDSGVHVVLSVGAVPPTILLEAASDESIVAAGDMDGDGRADLLVHSAAEFRFFPGQTGGLRELTAARRAQAHEAVVPLGDVTGDRLTDVGVVFQTFRTSPPGTAFIPHIVIVPGSAAGPDHERGLRWDGDGLAFLPASGPAGAGDWNGDGVIDVVVSTELYDRGVRRIATAPEVSFVAAPPRRPPFSLRTR